MKKLFFLTFLLGSIANFAQNPEYYRVKKKNKLVELTPYDNSNITMYRISGLFDSAKKIVYVDTTNSYKVTVPKWLELKETNSLDFFGGTLPAINEVENAIVISSVKKSDYPSFNEFKNFVVEDENYISGVTPKWANDRTFLSIEKDSISFSKFTSYKVTVNRNGNIFVSNFVLIETNKAYLWIQFTATEETYSVNLPKFKDFVEELKIDI